MDTTFAYLISAGIVFFGGWIIAHSLPIWTLIGLLPVAVGSLSAYELLDDLLAIPVINRQRLDNLADLALGSDGQRVASGRYGRLT